MLYFLSLIAYIIPIIGYIVIPGKVGIFVFVENILLVFTYLFMRNKHMIQRPNIDKRLKRYLCVIVMGVINFLIFGEYTRINISMLISSVLANLGIIYSFLIEDIESVKFFIKSFLLVLVPSAFFSMFYWNGFLHFDPPHIISPLALFVLFCPFFCVKRYFLVLGVFALFIIGDIGVRSCLLTLSFCTAVLFLYKFLPNCFFAIIKKIRILMFVSPIILLILGSTDTFNIFSAIENQDVSSFDVGSSRKSSGHSLNTDSRTGVYNDVYDSIDGPLEFIFGKGEVINLESSWIETRHSVEAGILNVFLRYGVVGCVIFFALFWNASKIGMYYTNNQMTKMASLYLSYKFMYMFVEDGNIEISTFIAYGICMCSSIRLMDDRSIKDSFLRF